MNQPARAQVTLPPEAQTQASEIAAKGSAPLIITFASPGYSPQAMEQAQTASAQEANIATAQSALLARMVPFGVTNVKTFPFVPQMAFTVSSLDALQALYADPSIVNIQGDVATPPALSDSVSLVRADDVQSLFYTGQGMTVAILDTGVDRSHPDLSGKVVSEACYSTTNPALGSASLCPGGAASSTAVNSGFSCAATTSGCDHGTHVAGIAAGVAPKASLMAIQVFSRFTDNPPTNTPCANNGRTSPCTLTFPSDQIAALNRVFALRASFNIASVNMSLSGGSNTGICDTDSRRATVDLLRGVGIATVASSGNNGFTSAMGAPACISTAISVGATTKSDQVANYSNLSAMTTLLAPGSNINSTVLFDSYGVKDGTSMAAPHVAGAFAALKQARPNATVQDIASSLASTGPLIADARTGGLWSKRRMDTYQALCALITCDADDFRYVFPPQTLTGNISSANDRDHYFIFATAGSRVTLQMNRTSGNLDAYLELFDPNGVRVALNNNGGVDTNALINNYTMLQTGRYQVIARNADNFSTGAYQLVATQQVVTMNPIPVIDSLSPGSATGTQTGSDFFALIRGSNFMKQSQVLLGGQLRTSLFESSTRLWVRIRGSDLGLPWPRNVSIQVRNPEPGGGASNPRAFSITFPFLGESELVQPAAGSIVPIGVKTTFVISWTHPTDSWRTMQNMDLRLRDQNNDVAAQIRVVERPGSTSVYRLLNGTENAVSTDGVQPDEGLPGENKDLTITDTVTLHLADSQFFGSGRTATMTPTVTFGPNAAGVYNIEFRVDGPDGEVQDDDVLGQITIAPPACPMPVTGLTLNGPEAGIAQTDYTFTAVLAPANATSPITFTWSPEPKSGQGTASAVYNFASAGEHVVFLGAENCGSFAADVRTVGIRTTDAPDLAISKSAPAIALVSEPITYTLTITNRGATTAPDLSVLDTLPAGATWVSGGFPVGDFVQWPIGSLDGFGAMTQTTFVVTANATITNSNYAVGNAGGLTAAGTAPVVTRIVDAKALVASVNAASMHAAGVNVALPEGSVADDVIIALDLLSGPSQPLPFGASFAGRAFRLDAYQSNTLVPSFTPGERFSITINYSDADVAGKNESQLTLHGWAGGQWTTSGIACAPNPAGNSVTCSVETPFGEFALATRPTRVHLPIVIR
jgi:uncharacterized repeat protein (TIGR01451 family)